MVKRSAEAAACEVAGVVDVADAAPPPLSCELLTASGLGDRLLDAWAAKEHCDSPPMRLQCNDAYVSCAGARWRRCLAVHNYSQCSARRQRLADS